MGQRQMFCSDRGQAVVAVVAAIALASFVSEDSQAQFHRTWTVDFSPADVPRAGPQTEGDLAQARELIKSQHWDEAVELLRRLVESGQGGVVAVMPGRKDRFISLREYGHRQIAQLPAEALTLYRQRVDPLALQWYEEGKQARNTQLLRRLVDEMFCSSWGDDALLTLGELALQRGQHETARIYWQRVSPLMRGPVGEPIWLTFRNMDLEARWDEAYEIFLHRPTEPEWLAYPDSDIPLADVLARLVLVSIHERSFGRARVELAVLAKMFPAAKGQLGGRVLRYATKLRELLDASRDWPVLEPSADWTTFAGSPRRTRATRSAPQIQRAAWPSPIQLPTRTRTTTDLASFGYSGRRIAEDAEAPLSFHPLVVGNYLIYSDGVRIFAFDVRTGAPALGDVESRSKAWGLVYPRSPRDDARNPFQGVRPVGARRFTMTEYDGKLFARLEASSHDAVESLVGLDLASEFSLHCEIKADDASWTFEGAPLSDGRYLYVAMRHRDVGP